MVISPDLVDVPEEVLRLAVEVFQSVEKADAWLHTADRVLGGRKPMLMFGSTYETSLVTDRLYGYQYGDVV